MPIFSQVVAAIVSFFGTAGVAMAPYVAKLTPTAVLIATGAALYLRNRGNVPELILMAMYAVAGAVVAAQVGLLKAK